MPKLQPPSLGIWLLSKRLSDEWREFVIGDLDEEFATRAARSPLAARVWFWDQTIRALVRPLPVDQKNRSGGFSAENPPDLFLARTRRCARF